MGTNRKISFSDAVQAIVANHKKLYDLILAVLPSYRGEDKMPPRERRISRILDCEKNDAHRLLEDLATAAKAKPRGSLGADPDLLIAECRSLLDFLEDNLPSPECAAALNDTCQIEEAFVNFIKGISGADPKITRRAYAERVDKFVRDIKDSFRALGHAIVRYECELAHPSTARTETVTESERSAARKRMKSNYEKSGSSEWTQADAATLLGISTRQLRRYKTHPPKDWPGWENPIALKKWKINRDDRGEMAFAMKKSLSYKEGITERRMKSVV